MLNELPIAWVRNDFKVVWWGSEYPIHWDAEEGIPVLKQDVERLLKDDYSSSLPKI